MQITKQVDSNSKVSGFYFGGDRFESRPEQRLSSLRYFVLFQAPPGKYQDNILKLSHDNFLPGNTVA
jgi:hypothetical protein